MIGYECYTDYRTKEEIADEESYELEWYYYQSYEDEHFVYSQYFDE